MSSGGIEGNAESYEPWPNVRAITQDGRFVVFPSVASNLVPNDVNGYADVFVRDRTAGATELISIGADGHSTNEASFSPAISGDARYVAFTSFSSNLVPGDTGGVRREAQHPGALW